MKKKRKRRKMKKKTKMMKIYFDCKRENKYELNN
jgi:hypothetical protein